MTAFIRLLSYVPNSLSIKVYMFFFLAVLAAVFEMLTVILIAPLISLATGKSELSSEISVIAELTVNAGLFIGFFILVAVLGGGLRLIVLWLSGRLSQRVGVVINTQLLSATVAYVDSADVNSSELITAMTTKTHIVVNQCVLPVLNVILACVVIFLLSLSIVLVDWRIAVLGLAILIPFFVVAIAYSRARLLRNGQQIAEHSVKLVENVKAASEAKAELISISGGEFVSGNFRKSAGILAEAHSSNYFLSGYPRLAIELLIMGGMGLGVMLFVYTGNSLDGLVPALAATAVAIQKILPQFQQVYAGLSAIRSGKSSVDEILTMLDRACVTAGRGNAKDWDDKRVIQTFELKDLVVGRGTKEVFVGNFLFKPGTAIGIKGKSGSGKSTLLNTLAGVVKPISGFIFVNGKQITQPPISNYKIGLVPQAPYRFENSVLEAVYLKNKVDLSSADVDRLMALLAELHLIEFGQGVISIDESAVSLSGGQYQRLALLRLLLRSPSMILADELTNGLDPISKKSVLNLLRKFKQTGVLIIISHDPETLSICDQIIDLDGRCI